MEYYCIYVKIGCENSFKREAEEKIKSLDSESEFYFFSSLLYHGKAVRGETEEKAAILGYVFFRVKALTPNIISVLKTIKGFIHFLMANDNIVKMTGADYDTKVLCPYERDKAWCNYRPCDTNSCLSVIPAKRLKISSGIDYSLLEKNFVDNKDNFLKNFGSYISITDKYTYLINDVLKDKYRRDWKEDAKILEFCGAMRNTMHNNGTHLKADKEVVLDGKRYTLKKGEKQYSDDYSEIFVFVKELFNIYLEIIDASNFKKTIIS